MIKEQIAPGQVVNQVAERHTDEIKKSTITAAPPANWEMLTIAHKNFMIHTQVLGLDPFVICKWTSGDTVYDLFGLYRGCEECGYRSQVNQFYGHSRPIPDYIHDYNLAIDALTQVVEKIGITYLEMPPVPLVSPEDICYILTKFLGVAV